MNDYVLDKFDMALGTENSGWHDPSLDRAIDVLMKFSPQDWDNLQIIVLSKPSYWQERCAESVGCSEREEGIKILVTLLYSPFIPVAAVVVSQLGDELVQLPRMHEQRLQYLLNCLNCSNDHRATEVQKLIEHLLE